MFIKKRIIQEDLSEAWRLRRDLAWGSLYYGRQSVNWDTGQELLSLDIVGITTFRV